MRVFDISKLASDYTENDLRNLTVTDVRMAKEYGNLLRMRSDGSAESDQELKNSGEVVRVFGEAWKAKQSQASRRPENCRFRLMEENKIFPRTGCDACNAGLQNGHQCEYASKPVEVTPAVGTTIDDRDAIVKSINDGIEAAHAGDSPDMASSIYMLLLLDGWQVTRR